MTRITAFLSLGLLIWDAATVAAGDDAPNAVYDAADYMKLVANVENGAHYAVSAPESARIDVLHLYGNATERGFAQGRLLSEKILDFVNVGLPEFYKSEVDQIPLDKLPEWLQNAIKGLLKDAAPEAFHLALGYVLDQQKSFIGASKANVFDEIKGIAQGVCYNRTNCDADKLESTIQRINMLPELIQMQCSMMGAWGDAVPGKSLVQLRSLDFGGGPFANQSVFVVNHPTDSENSFAVVSFPAFVGAVTGFSDKISLSEKVDDVTGASRPKGTYKGQAVSFVIRDILQFADSKESAVSIAQAAQRTWSVWLGIGDYVSQKFVAMLYQMASALPYDDETLPSLTNQTRFKDVAYIDKHPQPSINPDMPSLVRQYYGNLTARNVATIFPRVMQSGDVHVTVTDFAKQEAYLATGLTDANGDYTRMACDSPFLKFDLQALWARPHK